MIVRVTGVGRRRIIHVKAEAEEERRRKSRQSAGIPRISRLRETPRNGNAPLLSLIETVDSLPLGLVIQHHAWLATNITGILSMSFVFPVREITSEAMLHLVNFVAGHTQFAAGSNDMLMIGEPGEAASWQEMLGRFSPYMFHSGIAYIG